MTDPNHWLHNMCRFLTSWRSTRGSETEPSQPLRENGLDLDLPGTRFSGLLDGSSEMPKNCRLFLNFVNILAVSIVVGLALEDTSTNDPQVQTNEDDHDHAEWSGVNEQDQNAGYGIQELRAEDSTLPSPKEDVETVKAGEANKRSEDTSTAAEQSGGVCNYCTALAKKAIRIIVDCGHCGNEEHTRGCRICGGIEDTGKDVRGDPVNFPADLEADHTHGEDLEGAAQGESKGCPGDLEGEAQGQRHLVQSHVTLYWRNRVLDILAPSLAPLPNLYDDSGNMTETGHRAGGNVVEGHDEGPQNRVPISGNVGSEHDTSNEEVHRLQDERDAANNLETILENEDNIHAAIQRARARTQEMDSLHDDSLRGATPSRTRVVIHLPASVLSSQPSLPDQHSRHPEPSSVLATRAASMADINDSPMPHAPSFVVIFNPALAPIETADPDFNNAPRPEYYGTFSHGGDTSNGVLHFSSSDDDEIRSQSPGLHAWRSWSTIVPSTRPRSRNSSTTPRERFRPRRRVTTRGPKCGLRMMKALRDDPTCTPEEGEARRQPGREDKRFSPKRGDVICRHTIAPGRGVVEIYFPGIEGHLQDGDTLARLKMDNVSYPTMLILSVKAYMFLQGRWMYLGRHQHGVRKPKTERLLG